MELCREVCPRVCCARDEVQLQATWWQRSTVWQHWVRWAAKEGCPDIGWKVRVPQKYNYMFSFKMNLERKILIIRKYKLE